MLEGGAIGENPRFDDGELILESDTREGGSELECAMANSLEVFVADDALEGGAMGERQRFDDLELIGESDTCEGEVFIECPLV